MIIIIVKIKIIIVARVYGSLPHGGERRDFGENSLPLRYPGGGSIPPHVPSLSGREQMGAEGGSRGEHNFMIFQDFLSAPSRTGGSKVP